MSNYDQLKSVFILHPSVSEVNVKIENTSTPIKIKLNINETVKLKLLTPFPGVTGVKNLNENLNSELNAKINKILTHIAKGHNYVLSGGTNFEHDYFELGINTFGVLKLYNKKKFNGNNEVIDVERSDGQEKTECVLSIKKNDNSNIDITEKMQEYFLNYLTLLNFIIALIKNDKRFVSRSKVNTEGLLDVEYDSLNKFFTNSDNKLNQKQETEQYSKMGKLFGREMRYDKVPMYGIGSKPKLFHTLIKYGSIANVGGPAHGMKKNADGTYTYAEIHNSEGPKKFIESGYTIVMEMLNTLNTIHTYNAEIKVDINIKELCNLLAVCEKENTSSRQNISDNLVSALLNIVKPEEEVSTENYITFLNNIYGVEIRNVDNAGTASTTVKSSNVKVDGGQSGTDGSDVSTVITKINSDSDSNSNNSKNDTTTTTYTTTPNNNFFRRRGGSLSDHNLLSDNNSSEGGQKSKTLKRKQQNQ